ncbi:Polysaccharide pyruvyl transferase OS=Bosea thiooxidans OX=53254 GN=ARD30_00090 PE=4 SV=1 [Bosea thiooxidans]
MAALRDNAWARDWYLDDQMAELYQSRMFYSDVVAEYEQLVRGLDLVLGYRLHGNLMALANGTPSIYFTYDSRTVEFADTFKIPSVDVFSGQDFRLEDYWDQSRFDRFNAAYARVYGQMRDFLVENRVDNKMVDRQTAEQPRKVA